VDEAHDDALVLTGGVARGHEDELAHGGALAERLRLRASRGEIVLQQRVCRIDIVAIGPLRCLVLALSQVEGFLKSNPMVMYRLLQGEARKVRTTTKWLS
jgi:hypothetical protein